MGILDWISKKKRQAGVTQAPTDETATSVPAGSASGTQPSPETEATIQITGDWLAQVWKEKPVRLFRKVDAAMAFLSQDKLPYLWDDEPQYIASVNEKPDPQREVRMVWTAAYLNHPDPVVILRTLREHVTTGLLESWMVAGWLPFLMIHAAPDVREGAARKIWDCEESTLRSLFGVFSGKYPGLASGSAKFAAEGEFQRRRKDIVKLLRNHCPPERKTFLEAQVSEVFGPSLAEGGAQKPAKEVRFKEEEVKEGPMGVTQTYEVYTAESKADALAYLETKTVTQMHYYVIVETPEGNWGKDITGVFEE